MEKGHLKEYSDLIENLAFNKEKMLYVNSGPEHAAIVFSNIFKYAKNEINIVAGNMNGGISNQPHYLENLDCFLRKNGKIRLLLTEYNFNNNKELFSLLSMYKFFNDKQVEVKTTSDTLINIETGKKVHVCLADEEIYRVEENVETYSAKGSFNDPSMVSMLKPIFFDMFDKGTSVKLN